MTPEKLKGYKGLEGLDDETALQLIESMRLFAVLTFRAYEQSLNDETQLKSQNNEQRGSIQKVREKEHSTVQEEQ